MGQICTPAASANDREIMESFNHTVSVSGLFKSLETLPAHKVTPTVAVHCLKRIIHLNNNRRRNNFEIDVSRKLTISTSALFQI